jgi:hypothetical protein
MILPLPPHSQVLNEPTYKESRKFWKGRWPTVQLLSVVSTCNTLLYCFNVFHIVMGNEMQVLTKGNLWQACSCHIHAIRLSPISWLVQFASTINTTSLKWTNRKPLICIILQEKSSIYDNLTVIDSHLPFCTCRFIIVTTELQCYTEVHKNSTSQCD